MFLSPSFTGMLRTVTGKSNRCDRQALALLLGSVSQQLSYDFNLNCRFLQETRERAEAHVSLVLVLRTLWSIMPDKLFTAADPNFEQLAVRSLQDIGITMPEADSVRAVSVIYRRLRAAHLSGRRGVTSLDLDEREHRKLLRSQDDRCALCRYRFLDFQIDYAQAESEDELFIEEHTPSEGEIVLERYYRRPVLDHIVPQFLGGDGPENWQVLCHSCNSGKGDGLAWILRRGFLPPSRPSDARIVGPSLRFAAISNYYAISDINDHRPNASGELRLYRRDPTRLPVFDNLEVRADGVGPL